MQEERVKGIRDNSREPSDLNMAKVAHQPTGEVGRGFLPDPGQTENLDRKKLPRDRAKNPLHPPYLKNRQCRPPVGQGESNEIKLAASVSDPRSASSCFLKNYLAACHVLHRGVNRHLSVYPPESTAFVGY